MSGMKRVLELVNLGLTQLEAMRYLADERAALDAGLPAPELPAVVLEKYGQQQLLFAPDVAQEEAA